MSVNLSSIVVIGDTNEKCTERIQLIQNFIESNGGYFERQALKECSLRPEGLDYLIQGNFNGKSLDLSIEYKSFPDFSGTWQELEDRLPRAMLAHAHVALIIEYPPVDLTDMESTNCRFINPNVRDGLANVLPLAVFEAKIDEWTNQGVHVRLIQSKTQLTTTLLNLLYFCTKEFHTGLWLSQKDYRTQYTNFLAHIPIRGSGYSVACKLVERFPNLHWLASYSEADIQDCIGKSMGTKWFQFLRDNTLMANRTDPDPDKEIDSETLKSMLNDIDTEILNYLLVGRTVDQIRDHFKCTNDTNETKDLLGYIKNLAEQDRVTSIGKGVFIAVKDKNTEQGNISSQRLNQIQEENAGEIMPMIPRLEEASTLGLTASLDSTLSPDATPNVQSQSTEQQGSNPVSGRINKDLTETESMSSESKPGTHDNSQSPSQDTIPPFTPIIRDGDQCKPTTCPVTSTQPKTLEQKIIDEIYIMPRSDNYIISMIMQEEKVKMPDAHKLMKKIISESRRIHLSQGMLSYSGVRAIPEYDIGV